LKPFADPEIMAVGGFTVLGYDDLLSKTMALSWIFDLADEKEKTVKRHKIHANNCAVRTDFFRANPFPDLPAFKKQCGFWLRDLSARGHQYMRTAEARTVHARIPATNSWYGAPGPRAWTATSRAFIPCPARGSADWAMPSNISARRSGGPGRTSSTRAQGSICRPGNDLPPWRSRSASSHRTRW
jgi:hypothetical protein